MSSCPEGTYGEIQNEGYYKCLPCYINCKSCSQNGNSINMNCDSCEENNIIFSKNCYKEYDSNTKTFYLPESGEISSCYNLYNYYIEENTYECINLIPTEGFFLSNSTTGLFSPCHTNCKTCSRKYSENNSNCDICKNQELNYLMEIVLKFVQMDIIHLKVVRHLIRKNVKSVMKDA